MDYPTFFSNSLKFLKIKNINKLDNDNYSSQIHITQIPVLHTISRIARSAILIKKITCCTYLFEPEMKSSSTAFLCQERAEIRRLPPTTGPILHSDKQKSQENPDRDNCYKLIGGSKHFYIMNFIYRWCHDETSSAPTSQLLQERQTTN
jgi:hypothetical protein